MTTHAIQPSDVTRFRNDLLARLGLDPDVASSLVLSRLLERARPCGDVRVDSPSFQLAEVLKRADIDPRPTLYYWHGWDAMDAFPAADLAARIAKLWASRPPDDASVFDNSLSWLVLIEHTGHVGVIKFEA